jgi:branched-chain amino acid transport system permease protein
MTSFFQYVVAGLSTGSAYAIIGISFVVVFRTTGIVNFAQGTFAVLGAFLAWYLGKYMPLWLAMIVALPLTATIGGLMALVAMGFRGRTTAFSSLIVTLGLAFLVEAVLRLAFGDTARSYPGITETAWDIGGVLVLPQYVLIGGVALFAALALTYLLRSTIVGQALVACSDSSRAAELVGLNLRSIGVLAFGAAGVLAAVGGILVTPITAVTYDRDVEIAIFGFAAAVFGGLGSIWLALVGGWVLGVAEQLVSGYWSSQYRLVVALVIMLVFIAWRSRKEIAV